MDLPFNQVVGKTYFNEFNDNRNCNFEKEAMKGQT